MAPDYGTQTAWPTVGNCDDTTGGFIHFYPSTSSCHIEVTPPDRKQAHRAIMRGVVAGQRTIRERSFKTLRPPKPHFVWKPQRF